MQLRKYFNWLFCFNIKRPSDDESAATSSDAKKAKRDENSNEESKSNLQAAEADEKPTSIIGA